MGYTRGIKIDWKMKFDTKLGFFNHSKINGLNELQANLKMKQTKN